MLNVGFVGVFVAAVADRARRIVEADTFYMSAGANTQNETRYRSASYDHDNHLNLPVWHPTWKRARFEVLYRASGIKVTERQLVIA
jgi:hypothetical protein